MQEEQLTYCSILKTKINVTNEEKTIKYIVENLEKLRGRYVCVSNVHTTVMAYRNISYRNVQNGAALVLPDGKPLSFVSRKRGYQEAQRVAGPDLMPQIFQVSKEKGYRHYFYGGKPETLEKLQESLKRKYPWLKIAGMYSPPFRQLKEAEDAEIITAINESKPDFIWVALGAPKQENWMHEHAGKVTGLMLGVGAAFDFEAGVVQRAPKWMQESYLEWLFRIIQDPVRLIPRYVSTNLSFIWNVHKENKKIKRVNRLPKEKLKIAMIGHKRIPSREGGVEIVVKELAIRMVQRGNIVEAYNRKGDHVSGKEFMNKIGKEYKGVRILTIPTLENRSFNAIIYATLASVRALFGGYDIIHFHAEGPCALIPICKLFGNRVVATIHGLDWQRSKWGNFASRVIKFGEKMAVKYADEVIVLSENMKAYFENTYQREVNYISNGIGKPEYKNVDIIEKQWNLAKDEYILFLARIVPEKGAHYLIEAYKNLNTDKKLVIAGGNSHTGNYYSELLEMAGDHKNIIFTDFVGGRDLEELFSNAYMFVLPSDVEGMAIGLLEAMSYGNCCLVSDIPENTEVIEDKAVIFKHGQIDDLQKKMQYLLDHPECVADYKRCAMDFICSKYSWDKVVDQTMDVYYGK